MPLLGNPTLRLFIGAALISLSPVWVKLVTVSPTTSERLIRPAHGLSKLSLWTMVPIS